MAKRYLDASAQDFSVETQALLKEEREIYDMLRAQKVKVVASMNKDATWLDENEAIVGHSYTKWGQLQTHIDEKPKAKVAVSKRQTLADYKAQQIANGYAS